MLTRLDEVTVDDGIVSGVYTSVPDTERVADLRQRVRRAMEQPPVDRVRAEDTSSIDLRFMAEPLAVRKARAIALKLSRMPTDLWAGQLFAGSITLEHPRVHYERGFPDYLTDEEQAKARERGMGIGCFGHIVPDYPRLLRKGLRGIIADVEMQRPDAESDAERAFLDSVVITLDAVMAFAARLAARCAREAQAASDARRAAELRQMAANLRQVPAGPAETLWQALQSVWLIHMIFPAILQNNALGRLDQYMWPYLEADLREERLDWTEAAELVDCFCLKFNERAKTTEDQLADYRDEVDNAPLKRTRHRTSSQFGTRRDRLDATNHWLQNIIIGGLTPEGTDGTNPLSFLLLRSYQRNKMTNPLLTLRVHPDSPDAILRCTCEVLKDGGGMPALFNDDALIPALERLGIPTPDARDYTNDGCWEVIIPGRTDFRFMRLSLMLCLEWALNRGYSRVDAACDDVEDGFRHGVDTGAPRRFETFDDVMRAFLTQLDAMVARTVHHVIKTLNLRSTVAPVPLLSALTDGTIEARRDLTAGGAKFRTFGMLAESAAHTIDSLVAIKTVIFENREATMAELCDALDANFEGHTPLRTKLQAAPKYGNDDERADAVGRAVIEAFVEAVNHHAQAYESLIKFPCGVATFSWYIGIGQGLGASSDGRLSGQPVSSNFSPALGRDMQGVSGAILSYAKMPHPNLPVGGPLDLRMPKTLVKGTSGTDRMVALLRSFCETGGSMMTLTVADTEELRAAQAEPDKYKSLRVRMGGWCAYFTMLSHEQQTHHILRQEGR
jgi:formate C-acetyltransferase